MEEYTTDELKDELKRREEWLASEEKYKEEYRIEAAKLKGGKFIFFKKAIGDGINSGEKFVYFEVEDVTLNFDNPPYYSMDVKFVTRLSEEIWQLDCGGGSRTSTVDYRGFMSDFREEFNVISMEEFDRMRTQILNKI